MANVLEDEKKQQVLALGRLGWSLRRIEEATGVRRETASAYLKAAGAHGHILMTDGAFADDGAFHPLATWDGDAVMKLLRERLLARLLDRHAISEDLVRKLLAWRHPGFSAHVGEAIASEDKKAIEDVACYLVRAPLSLKKLVYLDGQKAVLYRSRMNPSLGRNFEAPTSMAPTRAASGAPGGRQGRRTSRPEPTTKRRCPPSWARLISKVYHADPLVCRQCGGKLKVVAYVSDEISVQRILTALVHWPTTLGHDSNR
jgi:hypothetical protein